MANVALTLNSGRQTPLFAYVDFDYTHVSTTAVAVTAVRLPPNAVVIGGALVVKTEWDTSGSAVLDIGDSAVSTRYGSGIDLTAGTRTELTLTDYTATTGLDIAIKPTLTGAASTAGAARLEVSYFILDRATEVQPS